MEHGAVVANENGLMPCCHGFAEHMSWCEVGAELRALRERLMRAGVVRGAWADGDESDARWVEFSESQP